MLLDPGFPQLVEAKRLAMGLDPGALEIEITESTLMGDHDQARTALARLREIGVRTSIDDFGTGYSSLSYLRELPVHALKIDRSFITDLTSEPESEAIVRSIIELARNLRLETVAEGVEDGASATSSSGSAATTPRVSRSPARCRATRWPAGSTSTFSRTTTRPAARAGAPRSAPSSPRCRSPRWSTSGGCGSWSCRGRASGSGRRS